MTGRRFVRCAVLAAALFILRLDAKPVQAWLCLPPIFDDGLRLHPRPVPQVFWLELLLRQHEICWYRPASARERRIAVFGNSTVYGFPLAAEESFTALLNQHFEARRVRARLFNLGFVAASYMMREPQVFVGAALFLATTIYCFVIDTAESS